MTLKERRKPGVENRRLRSRGGRRRTDRRHETVTELRCERCERQTARLCAVSATAGALVLKYRCELCGLEIERPADHTSKQSV